MSDTNAFINAYVDNSIGMIHENISNILNLKTQLKVTNDLITQKDNIIKNLTDEVEQLKNEKLAHTNKLSHMDTLLLQITNMKNVIKQKQDEIETLKNTIKSEEPKVVINTKGKKTAKVVTANIDLPSQKENIDDF